MKFNNVVVALKGDILEQVGDIITASPRQVYQAIKEAFISRFASNEQKLMTVWHMLKGEKAISYYCERCESWLGMLSPKMQ